MKVQTKKSLVSLKQCLTGVVESWNLLQPPIIKMCFIKSKWNSYFEHYNKVLTFPERMNNSIRKKLAFLKTQELPEQFKAYISDIDVEKVINSNEEDVDLTFPHTSNEKNDSAPMNPQTIPKETVQEIFNEQIHSIKALIESLGDDALSIKHEMKQALLDLAETL